MKPNCDPTASLPAATFDAAAERSFVDQVMHRDPVALEQLARRIASVPRILAFRNSRIGRPLDEQDMQDVVQDTFVVILRRLSDYQPIAPLESWIHGICVHQLRDAVRRKIARRRTGPLEDTDPPSPEPAPDRAVLDGAEIVHLLGSLSGLEARILELKHLEGRTFTEVGALLRIPENTAKTLHYRAIMRLKTAIAANQTREETI